MSVRRGDRLAVWWAQGRFSLGFLALYLVGAATANLLAPTIASPWWPPAGLTFALLVRRGWRWVWLAWVGEYVSAMVNFHDGLDGLGSVVALVRDTSLSRVGWAVAAVLTVRVFRVDPALRRWRDVVGFVVGGAGVGALLSAASGMGQMYWNGWITVAKMPAAAADWWAGDAVAVVVLGSLLVMLGLVPWPQWRSAWSLEAAVQGLVILAVPVLTERVVAHQSYLFICFMPLIWIALRRSLLVTAATALVINVAATYAVSASSDHSSLTDLQVFMSVLTVTALLLGVTVTQINDLNRTLELRVSERTAQLAEANQHLSYQASHDSLTGLANRSLFDVRLQAAIDRQAGSGSPITVLLIDLDGFKAINDTHGHHVGDAVLVAAAQRLAACVRQDDTVARLGGDEFAVILQPGVSDAPGQEILCRIVDALSSQVEISADTGPVTVSVSGSIGAATAHGAIEAAALLREADTQMYQVKRTGKGRVGMIRVEPVPAA